MDVNTIIDAINGGNIQFIYEFLNDKAAVKFVNGDPGGFFRILGCAMYVDRERSRVDNVDEIYDDIILRLIKAARNGFFRLKSEGTTILMVALQTHMSYKIIDQLIKAGSDINAASYGNNMTPLMLALDAENDKDIIVELVNRGADVNCRDRDGWIPLFYAMCYYFDCPDFIMKLLEAGSNVHNLDNTGNNVLMINYCLCLGGSDCKTKESIDVLLKYGIDNNDLKHTNNEGDTILHTTTCKYLFELAIKAGVSIEAKNNRGLTPLLKELWSNYEEKLVYLLKCGANIHSIDSKLNTALHFCFKTIKYDRSSLPWPVEPGALDMLIYHGANMYARNGNDQTPLDIIESEEYFYKELAFIIPKHIILFDDDEFSFEKNVLEKLDRESVNSFFVACKRDLSVMQETFIADGITFYEFCILKRYYKSKLVNISLNEYKFSYSEVRQLFPVYSNVIIIRIKDNRLKKRELDLRKRFEKVLFSPVDSMKIDSSYELNYDCLYRIGRYLNYEEMFNVFCAAIEM